MPFRFGILTMWGIRIGLTWIYIGMFGGDLKMVWFFMIMEVKLVDVYCFGACTGEEKEACYYLMKIKNT